MVACYNGNISAWCSTGDLKSCSGGQEKYREPALWEQCQGKQKEMKPYRTKITITYFLNA